MRAFVRAAVTAVATVAATFAVATPATAQTAPASPDVDASLERMLELPFNPGYLPTGIDTAFGPTDYPDDYGLTDTAGGACCVAPVPDQPPLVDLAPPFPRFPETFDLVELASFDGTPLHAYVSIVPGAPGVVVQHGFNSNGKHSMVRWGAFLRANGFSVIVPDHRDVGREWERGGSWYPDGTRRGQTIGWKESEDLLAAAGVLRDRGVERIGVFGVSEGAQNAMLALGRDVDGLLDAVLTFSGPADQNTQIARNQAATAALLAVVTGETDVCGYLAEVGRREEFSATPRFMLRQASAVDALEGRYGVRGMDVPAVHFFAADDVLAPAYHATILASRTLGSDNQRTVLVQAGNHAYFYDRWWVQAATLSWFADQLGPTDAVGPTVAQTPGGIPLAQQTIDLSGTTRAEGDAELVREPVCPAATEPVGPTAMLATAADGLTARLDGRRSYSGWDEHVVARWSLDPGDGTRPVEGTDVTQALVAHRYARPGTYTVALTVQDDTGRSATRTAQVTVGAAPPAAPPAAAPPAPAQPAAAPAPPATRPVAARALPATGPPALLPAAAALLLLGAAALRRRREVQP